MLDIVSVAVLTAFLVAINVALYAVTNKSVSSNQTDEPELEIGSEISTDRQSTKTTEPTPRTHTPEQSLNTDEQLCNSCGEINESTFDFCKNCTTEL